MIRRGKEILIGNRRKGRETVYGSTISLLRSMVRVGVNERRRKYSDLMACDVARNSYVGMKKSSVRDSRRRYGKEGNGRKH